MTWTDGYISDVTYPAFFYKEMQPVWLATVAGFRGFSAPDLQQPFTLCELGCGMGINLLVSAVCHSEAHFVGVEFNEEHVRIARDAAAAIGIRNIEFIHADFSAFSQSDRRHFDFVTSHGVWSWIDPSQQAALLDCASRSLKPGGLLYLHYMCHPGSTDLLPLQHLLNLCGHLVPGPSPRKVQTGMKLLQQIAQCGAFADKPAMLRHLGNLAKRDPADLAHEFLTDHWRPQHSVDVHQQAGAAGLTLIGSADVFDNLDVSLSVPGKLQGLIRQTQVPALSETLKDIARNAHQRMDLFQMAPSALDRTAFLARLGAMRFRLLPGAPDRGPITFLTPIGPVTGAEAIFTPLLQRLAAGSASGAELLQLAPIGGDGHQLLQSLQLLMMQQWAHPEAPRLADHAEALQKLAQWLESNGIALRLIPECATAIA